MSDIQEQIQKERETAREVCSADATSGECAAAWDSVEELSAEAAHQKQNAPAKSSLEKYCDENPDALECRVYED
ncbi:MAG: Calvin cycle protein CP12 [Cyanobacteria bacterium J06600_6]